MLVSYGLQVGPRWPKYVHNLETIPGQNPPDGAL